MIETREADVEAPIREEVAGPLREPLMPQISIRSQIILITLSAIVMVVGQQAFFEGRTWAIAIMVALALVAMVFLLNVLTFLMANLYSVISSAIFSSTLGANESEPIRHSPTLVMPEEVIHGEAVYAEGSRDELGGNNSGNNQSSGNGEVENA